MLLLLLLAIGCEKDQAIELPIEKETTLEMNHEDHEHYNEVGSATDRGKKDKITICHHTSSATNPWVVITISRNAWSAHQSHGDVELVDKDGDGWVEAENNCVPGGDCDDNDPNVYPGAVEVLCNNIDDDCNPATLDSMEEICNNGIDDDCDGFVDGEDSDCSSTTCSTGVMIDYNGPLYVNVVDISGTHFWSEAIDACSNLVTDDGCNEWYLPSKDELDALFANKNTIGGFAGRGATYWSATDLGDISAWLQNFSNGLQSTSPRATKANCRCVRR